jgi:hypothetical protein
MVRMLDKIEGLLDRSTGAMSFVVIVPAWEHDFHFKALTDNRYNRGYFRINATDHCYCEGSQYNRKDKFRPAPFNTAVFCLQNERGRSEWPLTPEAEEDIRAVFSADIPAEKWKAKQDWEGLYVPKARRVQNEFYNFLVYKPEPNY